MSPRFRSKSAAIAPFGFIGSWIVGSGVTSTRQPVATAAPSAQAEPSGELVDVVPRERAQVEIGARVLGDDVRLLAAFDDDPVDARVGAELLAHLVEGDEELDDGVQRVAPAPGPRRRVRRLAVELRLYLDDAERGPPDLGPAAPVDHHRRVHVLEDPRLHQLDLARAALLRGRPDHLDAAREREGAERHGQGHPRARARGRDDVVAAGVADAGQRVVLGHDCDRRSGPSAVDRRAERRGEAAHGALDPGAVLGEELGEPRVRLLFLERELRMVVDSVGEGLELVREAVDGRGDPGLERVDRAAHHNGCREAGTRRGWRAVGTAWLRPANTLSVATPGVTLTP